MDFKKYLDLYGYVVIPNVLTKEEISHYTNLFESWRKSVPNLDFQHDKIDPHGIYKYHEVGHQRFAWEIRTNEKVQQPFKDIWETDELVVSFDGACYMDKDMKMIDSCWTHTDQAPEKKTKCCIQGFVSLTDNEHRTLRVYEGSHLLHEDYFYEGNRIYLDQINVKSDWQIIDQDYLETIKDKRKALKVSAGSMVLWDSRTFHQNQYGNHPEERIIQYVCYLPKNDPKNTITMRENRMRYFKTFRTTSHWPYPIHVNSMQWSHEHEINKSVYIDYAKLPPIDLNDLLPKINMLL